MDSESTVGLINLWNCYLTEEEFDRIVDEIRSNLSSNQAALTPSVSNVDAPEYRTWPVSLNKILRKDSNVSVEEVVKTKLMNAITNQFSNFQIELLSIIQMLTIVFKSNKLTVENDSPITREESSVDIILVFFLQIL